MIDVHQLSKAYGRLVAVSELSFRVEPGQVLGLVGRNGAGKTTTLRSIAGIISPSAGAIRLGGHSLSDAPLEAKRLLAYIPDEPQLFDALTVREHLEFIRCAYQLPHCDSEIDRLLAEFELVSKQHIPAEELSRGMRQKLGICCAYLHEPKVILFDEPMVGLDPHGIRNVKDSMVARANQGAAVVISSHMLAMVEDICTHLLVLEQGEMKFFGTAAELRLAYAANQSDCTLESIFLRATASFDQPTAALGTTTEVFAIGATP